MFTFKFLWYALVGWLLGVEQKVNEWLRKRVWWTGK